MDIAASSIYLIYPIVLILLLWGVKITPKGEWYQEQFPLDQSKCLQGLAAFVIMLHHASQKTCASWIPPLVVRHGLDAFLDVGYVLVGFFFFCSGYGLYKSVISKPEYLKVRQFFGKRVWPVIAGFYLSMLIYLAARYWRGQRIRPELLKAYLSGAQLCNKNAWYCIAIVILYLVFWLSFRMFRNKSSVFPVILVWVGTFAWLCVGTYIDHNDWWFCGEWWYNSVLLFPFGMSIARHEKSLSAFFRKRYVLTVVVIVIAGLFLGAVRISHMATGNLGYYGDTWNQPLMDKLACRFVTALAQNLVPVWFSLFFYALSVKVHFGNIFTRWMGTVTLEFYLIHGLFIELFGFNFLDVARPLKYIRNVGLYVVVVFACSVIGTVILQALLHPKRTVVLLTRQDP